MGEDGLEPRVAEAGALSEFGEGAIAQESTVVNDEDAVTDGFDIGDDVGGEQDSPVLLQLGKQITEGHHLQRIEPVGGFVEEQHGWIVD